MYVLRVRALIVLSLVSRLVIRFRLDAQSHRSQYVFSLSLLFGQSALTVQIVRTHVHARSLALFHSAHFCRLFKKIVARSTFDNDRLTGFEHHRLLFIELQITDSRIGIDVPTFINRFDLDSVRILSCIFLFYHIVVAIMSPTF